jgi:hypothetical protein
VMKEEGRGGVEAEETHWFVRFGIGLDGAKLVWRFIRGFSF